jgi:IS605 OrfB family transposase
LKGYTLKLIAQVKLDTTQEQFDALKLTLETVNDAANSISDFAWTNQVFRQYDIHRSQYYIVKEDFNLSAQVVVRVIAKVADAYKLSKKTPRVFADHGSISFDSRILSWKLDKQIVSIWTMSGRLKIPFLAGPNQIEMLKSLQGEADLVLRDGAFYLHQVCDIPESPKFKPDDFMGIDFGICAIASTSSGKSYSGNELNGRRHRNLKLRSKLQKKGTKSAKRLLKHRRRKESRFTKDVNHCISKQIVADAKHTNQAIVLEDLQGIRERIRVRKNQRYIQHSWAFAELKQFITYKAKRAGVPLIIVDPRNSSRECSVCHCVDKRNRKSQSVFSCISCGFSANADFNASLNLSYRGRLAVNQAIAVGV